MSWAAASIIGIIFGMMTERLLRGASRTVRTLNPILAVLAGIGFGFITLPLMGVGFGHALGFFISARTSAAERAARHVGGVGVTRPAERP
jgi:hypothetical protein